MLFKKIRKKRKQRYTFLFRFSKRSSKNRSQSTNKRGEWVRGCRLRKKDILVTKPGEGGLKALVDRLLKKEPIFAAPLVILLWV